MKRLHRRDLWCWSSYYEKLDIDFNSFVWTRDGGNVVIDPLPMTPHDRAHLAKLGGAAWVVITNSDHVRGARALVDEFGAKVAGPAAERERFPIACDAWISEHEPLLPWRVYELDGSKTPGELALLIDHSTLVTGDLVRAHRPASLMMLRPEQGLRDDAAERAFGGGGERLDVFDARHVAAHGGAADLARGPLRGGFVDIGANDACAAFVQLEAKGAAEAAAGAGDDGARRVDEGHQDLPGSSVRARSAS